ncbi:hypothetical protein D3C87_1578100 [compost metagenome]
MCAPDFKRGTPTRYSAVSGSCLRISHDPAGPFEIVTAGRERSAHIPAAILGWGSPLCVNTATDIVVPVVETIRQITPEGMGDRNACGEIFRKCVSESNSRQNIGIAIKATDLGLCAIAGLTSSGGVTTVLQAHKAHALHFHHGECFVGGGRNRPNGIVNVNQGRDLRLWSFWIHRVNRNKLPESSMRVPTGRRG